MTTEVRSARITLNGEQVDFIHPSGLETAGTHLLERLVAELSNLLAATTQIEMAIEGHEESDQVEERKPSSRMLFAEALTSDHYDGADFDLSFNEGTNATLTITATTPDGWQGKWEIRQVEGGFLEASS